MTSLVLTVTESLRYRGMLGQWSWILHRTAGVGTLLFVILHVIDTSWATFYPELYAEAIAAYKTPLYTLGEFGLVACVIYHALNGFRIVLFDWRPQWWRHQADAAKLVLLGTVVILIPTSLVMFGHVVNYYQNRVTAFDLQLDKVVHSVVPFVIGTVVIFVAAMAVSVVLGLVPGMGGLKAAPKKKYGKSRFDTFMWTFMRVSGVLIIPLVFGHLAMIHLISGVFDITLVGAVPAGTTLGPNLATELTAVNFVRLRWDTMFAGVFIWRLYDAALLILIIIHGFNGARYVVNDYFRNPVLKRALNIMIIGAMVGYIVVGTAAIITTVPATTAEMLNRTSQVVGPAQWLAE
jgi:succinate dehydrogenase / fumarate reductase, cytochrome b subunit